MPLLGLPIKWVADGPGDSHTFLGYQTAIGSHEHIFHTRFKRDEYADVPVKSRADRDNLTIANVLLFLCIY